MPVAMITRSQARGAPEANTRRLPPFASSIRVSVTPVRTVTPWSASHRATRPAPVSSIIRGRIRGATSTIVSRAPSERIEFRIVNAMNPAPTSTTWLRGRMPASTARASSSVQNEWPARPSAPGTGARTAEEPVAIRQSSYSSVVPSSSVHTPACVSSAVARLPLRLAAPPPAGTRGGAAGAGGGVEVVGQDHRRVRPLGGDEGDLRALALLLADRADRVDPRGAAADDQVSLGHYRISRILAPP